MSWSLIAQSNRKALSYRQARGVVCLAACLLALLLLAACSADSTDSPPLSPPTVNTTDPAPDSTAVPPDTTLSVSFSTAIDPATATSAAIEIRDADNNSVSGSVVVADYRVVFKPTNALAFDTRYTVTISSSVRAVNGLGLAAPHTWIFSTAKKPALRLFAGNLAGAGTEDGTGAAAWFHGPKGIAVDANRNVFVADTENHTIRKISSAGVVTTLAGMAGVAGSVDSTGTSARFNTPTAIAIDSSGNLWVADTINSSIRKISPTGAVTTLAGSASAFPGSVDATTARDARFNLPQGISVDGAGNVFVADTGNNTIRKIDVSGRVTTVAGAAGEADSVNGSGVGARFSQPQGIAVDADGNLFVADTANHTVRKIDPLGEVTTLAGVATLAGTVDGFGSDARFNRPTSLFLSAGFVYVAEADGHLLRKMALDGTVTTLAGNAGLPGNVNGDVAEARFNRPHAVAVAADGATIYVADTGNDVIRKIDSGGIVTALAGSAGLAGSSDGTGAAARFNRAFGLATDSAGDVFVSDFGNQTIRKIAPTGVVTTLAGSAAEKGSADGTGAQAKFSGPQGIASDANGNVFVADSANSTIRKVSPTGVATTFAGTAGSEGAADGSGIAARFGQAQGVATDASGNVYVADSYNHAIRKITAGGIVTTLAGAAGVQGSVDAKGTSALFSFPQGLAVDSAGSVYVADSGNHVIRKITASGDVSTLAGSAGDEGSVDGQGVDARFSWPQTVVVDAVGNIYVADTGNHTIRKITPAGVVTTVLGKAGKRGFAVDPLPGLLASPVGLALSGRSLYISLYNGVAVLENAP